MSEEKTYTIGSLFAGIGGFDLGFERAGFKTAWQVEIDPYCQKVLAKNFPEAERFGDIRECGSHNLKLVDVICGGFPCQDISYAGLGAGITGERSGLVVEAVRIIRELRPSFVLLENVAALLRRGMGEVLGYLAEIGYDAEWEIISAADAGAPHLRERIWILAHPTRELLDWGRSIAGQAGRDEPSDSGEGVWPRGVRLRESGAEGWHGSTRQRRVSYPQLGPETKTSAMASFTGESSYPYGDDAQREFAGSFDAKERGEQKQRSIGPCYAGAGGQWAVEPNVGRVAHGVPKRVDRLRGLGNAVVPQIPEMIARRIKQALDS